MWVVAACQESVDAGEVEGEAQGLGVEVDGVVVEAGERAAGRLIREGRRVRIALPPTVGTDFNDLLGEPGP